MHQIIGFVSGKGGMGKTALCAAIATALAKSGKRVLCVDCDGDAGDLAYYLGLAEAQNLTYAEICRGYYPLERATAHPHWTGLRFLAAPTAHQAVQEADFAALLHRAREQFDVILLDGPAISAPVDQWLLVTHADPAAIRGARCLANALEVAGASSIRLLINGLEAKALSVFRLTVDDVMDQVGLPLLGILPRDMAVQLAAAQAEPLLLYAKKGAAAAVLRITDRLLDIRTPIPGRIK